MITPGCLHEVDMEMHSNSPLLEAQPAHAHPPELSSSMILLRPNGAHVYPQNDFD